MRSIVKTKSSLTVDISNDTRLTFHLLHINLIKCRTKFFRVLLESTDFIYSYNFSSISLITVSHGTRTTRNLLQLTICKIEFQNIVKNSKIGRNRWVLIERSSSHNPIYSLPRWTKCVPSDQFDTICFALCTLAMQVFGYDWVRKWPARLLLVR